MISFLDNGRVHKASAEFLERIASVLETKPSVFTEYRMVWIMNQLNPSKVGFAKAAVALQATEAAREELLGDDLASQPDCEQVFV